MKRDVRWLYDNIQGKCTDTMWYPMNLYKKYGKDVFNKKPQVYIGTVHSFKGAEASNVFVYPDISFATTQDSNEDIDAYDSLCRLFYVAVTRSRNDLYLMEAASKNFFEF